jgi:hypothetical protein
MEMLEREEARTSVRSMGIEEGPIAPRSPWQNPYCERLLGSIRRDCLDHVLVLNEDHLRRILKACFEYYHRSRTHLSLERNSPIPREVEPSCRGKVKSIPQLGNRRPERISGRSACPEHMVGVIAKDNNLISTTP